MSELESGVVEASDRAAVPRSKDGAGDLATQEQTCCDLNASDRRVVTVLGALIFLLLGWNLWSGFSSAEETVEISRLESRQLEFQVDVNSATWVEWMQLPGIGETLSRRIVEDRTEQGPFRSIEDVRRVKGIGPAKMEGMRPWLVMRETDASGP